MDKVVPSKAQDLALPALAEVRQRIAASIKYVEPLRPLLDKNPAARDAPELLNLLNTSTKRQTSCGSDAIVDRLGDQLRSLNDPEIALRAFSISPDWRAPMAFLSGNSLDAGGTDSRVRYLLQMLSDRKREVSLRIAALQTLLNVSWYSSGLQTPALLDKGPLRAFAGQIYSIARTIFDDESEDDRLRSLCLQFTSVDSPDILADIKTIYQRTRSEEVRFAIEDLFLNISDATYGELNPPGGPIASIVLADSPQSCVKSRSNNVTFVVKYRFRKDETARTGQPSIGVNGPGMLQIVLTDVRDGKRFTPRVTFLSGSIRSFDGQNLFELADPIDVAAGQYYLWAEFTHSGQVFSDSRRRVIGITETPNGKKVVLR
jgi:hypothetical protein